MNPVYTRWGKRTCPSGVTKLYEGFIASDYYTHPGSGYNYLCMHPQPQFPPGVSNGNQDGALLYGVEYQNTGAVDKNHNKDLAVSCANTRALLVYHTCSGVVRVVPMVTRQSTMV